jgi:hypothetical protein
MTDDRAFVETFRQVAGRRGRVNLPTALVEAWEHQVDAVADGYDWGYDEYSNDISVRDTVQRVLTDDRLRDFPQMAWVRERVQAADDRFRQLLQLDRELPSAVPLPWWHRHPPRYAEAELVDELQSLYGLRLDLWEREEPR